MRVYEFGDVIFSCMIAAVSGLVIGWVTGFCRAQSITDNDWQRRTVNRGVARYNAKTGAWEWGVPSE